MAKEKDYILDSDRNIFLTGKAGTGKSYKIREFTKKMEDEGKVVLICAPTGTAAVNVGGETAHSLFGIPVPCYGVSITKVPSAKIKVLAMADVIIIDEVSMMRNDVFSFAMRVLKKAEKLKGSRIRVILTGDFSQLPPVVTKKDVTYLKKFGYDVSGYAFTAKEWANLHLKTIELTKIYRQESDVEFAKQLGKIRVNDPSCLSYFKQFVNTEYEPLDDDVIICGTNAEADEINRKYLESIDEPLVAYQAEKHGRNTMGICDDIVLLKKGAKVMFLVNDVRKNQYFNGMLGTIIDINSKCATVRIEDGKDVVVFPNEYKSYSYKVIGGSLVKNEVGSIIQMPLKVAKAMTIHKSQGKTFDKVVISPDIFAPGQLYVALSRVTSASGLVLTKEIKLGDFKDNDIVDEFIANGYSYEIKKSVRKAVKKTPVKKKTDTKKVKKIAAKKITSKGSSKTGTKKASTKAGVKKTASKTGTKKISSKTGIKRTATKKTAKKKSISASSVKRKGPKKSEE